MALQKLQVGVAGHQASKGIIGTASHGVQQLLGGLQERSREKVRGEAGRDRHSSLPCYIHPGSSRTQQCLELSHTLSGGFFWKLS